MAFTIGAGQPPRIRSVPARCTNFGLSEIKKAKLGFGLATDAPVVSCYEAGCDGFWIHRFLAHEGIQNIVVDSASIEVSRRKRRAKSDRLDAVKLVSMLIRWHNGEKKVWSVVHIPTVADMDRRQLHRELIELKSERTEVDNRVKEFFGWRLIGNRRELASLAGLAPTPYDSGNSDRCLHGEVSGPLQGWRSATLAFRARDGIPKCAAAAEPKCCRCSKRYASNPCRSNCSDYSSANG
jgi:hypothetical protein